MMHGGLNWINHDILDKSRHRRRQEREDRIRNNLERNYERHLKVIQALAHYRSRAD